MSLYFYINSVVFVYLNQMSSVACFPFTEARVTL